MQSTTVLAESEFHLKNSLLSPVADRQQSPNQINCYQKMLKDTSLVLQTMKITYHLGWRIRMFSHNMFYQVAFCKTKLATQWTAKWLWLIDRQCFATIIQFWMKQKSVILRNYIMSSRFLWGNSRWGKRLFILPFTLCHIWWQLGLL